MASLFISNYIARKDNDKFPFGKSILEPLIISIKSLIILLMCLYSLRNAIISIANGGNTVQYGFAMIYSIISVVGCGIITTYMIVKGKKISSELIEAESNQWLMDTLLSGAVLVGFLIAMVLGKTKYQYLTPYIDPIMTVVVSALFLKLPIVTFIKSFKELICVKADDNINDDIYVLVKEIQEEYNFEDSIARVSKVGRELRIEIDFIYNDESKLKSLDQMDNVREEINEAIKHIKYKKWLNVSFTGDRKWAV